MLQAAFPFLGLDMASFVIMLLTSRFVFPILAPIHELMSFRLYFHTDKLSKPMPKPIRTYGLP